jgi:hypothetical protein
MFGRLISSAPFTDGTFAVVRTDYTASAVALGTVIKNTLYKTQHSYPRGRAALHLYQSPRPTSKYLYLVTSAEVVMSFVPIAWGHPALQALKYLAVRGVRKVRSRNSIIT